jgi:predicted nucleotide-binding protein
MAKITKREAITKLQKLVDQVDAEDISVWKSNYKKWERDSEVAIIRIFGEQSRHFADFKEASRWGETNVKPVLQSIIDEIKEYGISESPAAPAPKTGEARIEGEAASKPRVFIGHGRSSLWARVEQFLEKELGMETVNYESESRVSESIISVLEEMLNQASFAVLVLTAEDATGNGGKRARQNVIHEAGLFQGRLGFKKVVLLKQDGLEDFSNVDGLQHISFSGDEISDTFYELQRVLKREGLLG